MISNSLTSNWEGANTPPERGLSSSRLPCISPRWHSLLIHLCRIKASCLNTRAPPPWKLLAVAESKVLSNGQRSAFLVECLGKYSRTEPFVLFSVVICHLSSVGWVFQMILGPTSTLVARFPRRKTRETTALFLVPFIFLFIVEDTPLPQP